MRTVETVSRGADRYRRVSLACVEDDAEGEELEVIWEHELDARVSVLDFAQLGQRGFDPADRFAAYVHALRWNAVSAGDAEIIQSPWRAGIEVLTNQLGPLQRALQLPRPDLVTPSDADGPRERALRARRHRGQLPNSVQYPLEGQAGWLALPRRC